MWKILNKSGLLTLLFYGCAIDSEPHNQIDYNNLNVIDINLDMEIGESSDYIHGELGQLVLSEDGTMLVSDWGKKTIEQFNKNGKHIFTIAKEGRGPGEISDFVSLNAGSNDTLIVRSHSLSYRTDFFTREDNDIYRYVKSHVMGTFQERSIITIAPRSETEYYARDHWNTQHGHFINNNQEEYGWLPVIIVDAYENILVDSLHMLKIPIAIIRISEGGATTVLGSVPYQTVDRLRLIGEHHYVISRPDSSALFIYNHKHELEKQIALNIKERPVNKSDSDFWFDLRNVTDRNRRELQDRVPALKPVLLNFWTSEDFFWLHVDTNEKGKKLVVLTMEGKPLGSFYLPVYDQIQTIRNNRIYALSKDPDLGHSIRIYNVSL